jgi:hypothetical protein
MKKLLSVLVALAFILGAGMNSYATPKAKKTTKVVARAKKATAKKYMKKEAKPAKKAAVKKMAAKKKLEVKKKK